MAQRKEVEIYSADQVHARRPINARAETVATSGMFRRAFELRHAIVPADTFYERRVVENSKQPCAIARQDEQLMAFGLCGRVFAGRTAT